MMARDTVWGAMASAYETTEGDLAERLLAALDAAQAEGGDIRGRQTAALLIVDRRPAPTPLINLRVDHDPTPLVQLRRLLRLHRAYALQYQIEDYIAGGQKEQVYDMIGQIGELAPDEPYLQCLRALYLERQFGLREEALAILKPLIEAKPQWRDYLDREWQASKNDSCHQLDRQFLIELDAM